MRVELTDMEVIHIRVALRQYMGAQPGPLYGPARSALRKFEATVRDDLSQRTVFLEYENGEEAP